MDRDEQSRIAREAHDGSQARVAWEIYNGRQEFEHDLINRKISWFLTTQSIMFAAYGLTIKEAPDREEAEIFRCVVAWVGLLLGVITVFGVGAVINSKWRSFHAYRSFCKMEKIKPMEPHGASEAKWGLGTLNTLVSLAPDILTPVLFIAGWGYLILNFK